MLAIVRGHVPVFDSVTGRGLLLLPTSKEGGEKARLDGDSTAMGAAPVPDKLMLCGLAGASSRRVMELDTKPVAVGLKVTEKVQLALGSRTVGMVPQVFV